MIGQTKPSEEISQGPTDPPLTGCIIVLLAFTLPAPKDGAVPALKLSGSPEPIPNEFIMVK